MLITENLKAEAQNCSQILAATLVEKGLSWAGIRDNLKSSQLKEAQCPIINRLIFALLPCIDQVEEFPFPVFLSSLWLLNHTALTCPFCY